jgi:hypothetical protein
MPVTAGDAQAASTASIETVAQASTVRRLILKGGLRFVISSLPENMTGNNESGIPGLRRQH